MNEQRCYQCGNKLTGHTDVLSETETTPQSGSISICIYCFAIGIFCDDSSIRRPSPGEFQSLTRHPVVLEGLATLITMRILEVATASEHNVN